MAIASQASGHTVFGHAQAPEALGMDVVDGFGAVAAVNAALVREAMQ
jgi:hypothetical protein